MGGIQRTEGSGLDPGWGFWICHRYEDLHGGVETYIRMIYPYFMYFCLSVCMSVCMSVSEWMSKWVNDMSTVLSDMTLDQMLAMWL